MTDGVAPVHKGWWAANEKPEERQRRKESEYVTHAVFGPLLIENPLAVRVQHVPHALRLSPGHIEWTLGDASHHGWRGGWRADGYHPPNPALVPEDVCLTAFMRLADEQDEGQFLQFAQRYGVLGLCPTQNEESRKINGVQFRAGGERNELQEWYPGIRDGSLPPRAIIEPENVDAPDAWMQWYREPIAGWRAYARQARAVMQIAFTVRDGQRAGREEWQCFYEDKDAHRFADADLEGQRGVLAHMVSRRWIENAGVSLQLHSYNDGIPRLSLETGGFYGPRAARAKVEEQNIYKQDGLALGWPRHSLFSTLALQLMAVVCANDRLVRCAGCGMIFPYQGKQRPRTDQPHYCSTACQDEASREDKREYAARQRAKKKEEAKAAGATP
ncbi:MAG: hypothetical protein ACR2M3_08815 [Thermomicrobiales bacterium]